MGQDPGLWELMVEQVRHTGHKFDHNVKSNMQWYWRLGSYGNLKGKQLFGEGD